MCLPFNCYEMGHTWTPYCSKAACDIGWFVFTEAIKSYTGLYLLVSIRQLWSKKSLNSKQLREILVSILRSSSFLGFNAFSVLILFCLTNHSVGKLYLSLMGHFPSIVGSFLSIHLEKPSRRGPLAFYVANIAAETIYRLLVNKKLIKPIYCGEVLLFSFTMSAMMYYIHKNGFNSDAISLVIKKLIGKEEVNYLKMKKDFHTNNQNVVPTVNHSSCHKYLIKSIIKQFVIAWTGISAVKILYKNKPSNLSQKVVYKILTSKDCINFALFVSTFTGIYQATNCLFRQLNDHPINTDSHIDWSKYVPGFCAGLSMAFYPSKTIAQYTFWKMVEIAFFDAVKQGKIANHELIIKIIYAISCSQLFFVAAISPTNLRTSYMKFLDRFTHRALHLLNRNILDLFGTNSSAGFEKFIPNLDLKYTSRQFQEAVLVWTIQ